MNKLSAAGHLIVSLVFFGVSGALIYTGSEILAAFGVLGIALGFGSLVACYEDWVGQRIEVD